MDFGNLRADAGCFLVALGLLDDSEELRAPTLRLGAIAELCGPRSLEMSRPVHSVSASSCAMWTRNSSAIC